MMAASAQVFFFGVINVTGVIGVVIAVIAIVRSLPFM
jgi:hypothetical protein